MQRVVELEPNLLIQGEGIMASGIVLAIALFFLWRVGLTIMVFVSQLKEKDDE